MAAVERSYRAKEKIRPTTTEQVKEELPALSLPSLSLIAKAPPLLPPRRGWKVKDGGAEMIKEENPTAAVSTPRIPWNHANGF